MNLGDLARAVDDLRADLRRLDLDLSSLARLVERQADSIDRLQRALVALDKRDRPEEVDEE